jgi:hypothetical protein
MIKTIKKICKFNNKITRDDLIDEIKAYINLYGDLIHAVPHYKELRRRATFCIEHAPLDMMPQVVLLDEPDFSSSPCPGSVVWKSKK